MRRLAAAVAIAFFALAGPASADRTDDFAKPVLFVPGPGQDCSIFDDMQVALTEYTTSVAGEKIGFSGEMDAVGLRPGASGCSSTLSGAAGDSVAALGTKLAAHIAAKKTPVDVVAFGEGGLVLRAALAQDKRLQVEDAITVGTPHGGSDLARNPQGYGGTDWSVIASEADTAVPVESAIDMDAEHKTVYRAGGPTHDGLLTDVSEARDAKIRYSHGQGKWTEWNNAPHAVSRVAEDLIYGGGTTAGACGLQATQPELCGKTPVILVPGFGASELQCDGAFGTATTWPTALFEGHLWLRMSLAADGKSTGEPGNVCSRTVRPTGNPLEYIIGAGEDGKLSIHASSTAWIKRIAPGYGYAFGWDFRKGPDQTLARLDKFIDEVRAKHGATKVALVAHSYGGLLSRAYIDDPTRARKVARVANFGSPFWGAPKAWFAMAYGYESPSFSEMDTLTPDATFKHFAKNLTGLYYLIPPKAWFDNAPANLRNWLEVNDKAMTDTDQVVDQVRAFGGNGPLAAEVAQYQTDHISGFKRTNGVDWRVFAGSGLASLGHVRAYTGTTNVQYSWVNGDGTVPLISQRQSPKHGAQQLGDKTPVYNFCGIPHMEEMEHFEIQNAVTRFVRDGENPLVDNTTLKHFPCELNASEFKVTGDEDARSVEISKAAAANGARARAAQVGDVPQRLSARAAEAAGLVELVDDGHQLVIVPSTNVTLHFKAGAAGTVRATPLIGDDRRGTPREYDIPAGGMDLAARGRQAVATATGGGVLKGRKADTSPPKTKVKVRRAGARRILTATAKDVSGVAVTMVQVGNARPKPWQQSLKVSRRATVRYWSVDTVGNAERHRKVKLR